VSYGCYIGSRGSSTSLGFTHLPHAVRAGEFDPVFLEDRYRTVLVEKLREKQAEMPVKLEAAAPSRQNVIDLI
jgi:hypothetical protein